MSLESELSEIFHRNGWTWHLKGDRNVVPDEKDIEAALDEAARLLFNEKPGTRLEVGRLIIEKKHRGHDVYMYIGSYE